MFGTAGFGLAHKFTNAENAPRVTFKQEGESFDKAQERVVDFWGGQWQCDQGAIIDDAIDAGNAVSDGLDNILDQINIPDVTLTLDDVIDIKQ